MNILLVGLVVAVLPATAELRQSLNAAQITLYTSFEQAPPDALVSELQLEVESIMEPAGLQFEWRTLGPDSANHVSVELVVVTFKGSCELGPPPLHYVDGPLGRTHTSDGEVLPFVEVDCNRLRGFLNTSLAAYEPGLREHVFGRAAARVLAHELFHVLLRTRKHGALGVAKPCHTVHDLLADTFRFEPREQQMLRRTRTRLLSENAEITSPATGQ